MNELKKENLDILPESRSEQVKKTVVIVEDDDGLRMQLSGLLATTPDLECIYSVASGEEALLRIPKRVPDVVLMDIKLPGLTGIDCVQILKRQHPLLEVIMLTIYQDAASIFEALKAGANGYLLKSSDPLALYCAIRDVSKGGAPFTSLIARKVVKHFRGEKTAFTPAKEDISRRELEVLNLLAEGYRYREVAVQLGISIETVRSHVKRICAKMHVRNRIEAIVKLRHCPE